MHVCRIVCIGVFITARAPRATCGKGEVVEACDEKNIWQGKASERSSKQFASIDGRRSAAGWLGMEQDLSLILPFNSIPFHSLPSDSSDSSSITDFLDVSSRLASVCFILFRTPNETKRITQRNATQRIVDSHTYNYHGYSHTHTHAHTYLFLSWDAYISSW